MDLSYIDPHFITCNSNLLLPAIKSKKRGRRGVQREKEGGREGGRERGRETGRPGDWEGRRESVCH